MRTSRSDQRLEGGDDPRNARAEERSDDSADGWGPRRLSRRGGKGACPSCSCKAPLTPVIGEIVRERFDALFHVDGVQAVGKIPIDLTNVDLFALSGHKLHAPQGIGALYIRKGVSLPSFIIGGAQEHGRRAGTSAVPNIVGLGAACKLAHEDDDHSRIRARERGR